MSEYKPDGWAIIKHGKDFFIFGSWSGSFASGDHWRRNSGVTGYKEDENYYHFKGDSGSVYSCSKHSNHITAYNSTVLLASVDGNDNASIVSIEEFLEEFDND